MKKLFALVGNNGTRTNVGDDWDKWIFCFGVEYNNSYKVWICCIWMRWDLKSWRLMGIEDSEFAECLEDFIGGLSVERRAGFYKLVGAGYNIGFANGVNSLFDEKGKEVEWRKYFSDRVDECEIDDGDVV